MDFHLQHSIEILERTPQILRAWLSGLSPEWTSPNEGGDSWSAYDIVGHLIHGEKTDWIPRANIILHGEGERRFVSFDRFAQFEDSKGKSLAELLDEFERLRAENIKALRALDISEKTLNMKGTHPELGPVNLHQLLATWTVHDLGHLAQIARVMAKQYKDQVGPWAAYLGVLQR